MRKLHTEPTYDTDLDRIRSLVVDMGSVVEEMLAGALRALSDRDGEGARAIAARDQEVNALEVEIDERCLAVLTRWQPVAADLRFVGATLKLVTDLERVGDQCVNLCEGVQELQVTPAEPPTELAPLLVAVPVLLREALVAWNTEDARLAVAVIERGQLLDTIAREVARGCFALSRHAPGAAAVVWHEIAGCLHRIGGHATNVAEMVVFQVRGEDVRHHARLPTGEGSRPGVSAP